MALGVGARGGEIECLGGPPGFERFAHRAARDRTKLTLPSHVSEGRRQVVSSARSKTLALA